MLSAAKHLLAVGRCFASLSMTAPVPSYVALHYWLLTSSGARPWPTTALAWS